jgi:hypothetical protein
MNWNDKEEHKTQTTKNAIHRTSIEDVKRKQAEA